MPSCTFTDIEGNTSTYIDRDKGQLSPPSWRAPWAKSWKMATLFQHLKSGPSVLKDISNRDGPLLSVYERAAQCTFLCLRSGENSYAIQIPCMRAGERRLVGRQLGNHDGVFRFRSGGEIYESPIINQEGFEDDATIWARMKQACFNEAGSWKRWLPFYGPTAVREVEFQFVGTENGARRFQIFDLTYVNEEKVREKADQIIASVPNEVDYEYDNGCMGFDHSTKCPASSDGDSACILDMADEALFTKRKLGMLFLLKDCAKDPGKANGLNTLEGMAQASCIYDLVKINLPRRHRPFTHADKIRGLEIAMGWQSEVIESRLPFFITWTWFCLALIWFAVIIWGGATEDWSGAMAFGQLLAACLSLTALHAKN